MNIINMEILEDGTITVKTTEISTANHMSADNLIADLEKLIGGSVTAKSNPDADAKVHKHMHKHNVAHNHS